MRERISLCRFQSPTNVSSHMADQRAASRTPRHLMSRVSDLKCDLHKSFHEFEYRNSVQDRSMLVVLLLLSPFLFQAPSVDCKVCQIGNHTKEMYCSFQLKLRKEMA